MEAFLKALDNESIATFQATYYALITVAGLYLITVADGPPQNVEPVMGWPWYQCWLGMNIACPAMSLIGRRLTARAALAKPGQPTLALPAAWMQLTGDAGVWFCILIYVACILVTTEWGTGVYGFFFVLMGIPGGAMFTLRSLRRLLQIKHRERAL